MANKKSLVLKCIGLILLVNGLFELYFAILNGIVSYYRFGGNLLFSAVHIALSSVLGIIAGFCMFVGAYQELAKLFVTPFFVIKLAINSFGLREGGVVEFFEQAMPSAGFFGLYEMSFEGVLALLMIWVYWPLRSFRNLLDAIPRRSIIIAVASAVIIVSAVASITWSRIESVLGSGLSNLQAHSGMKRHLEEWAMQRDIKMKKEEGSMLLFLKSEACGTCIMEILFWNATPFPTKIGTIVFFPTDDPDKKNFSRVVNLDDLKIKFPIFYLQRDTYSEVVGRSPRLATRLLYDSNGRLRAVNNEDDENIVRKSVIDNLQKLKNLEKGQEIN